MIYTVVCESLFEIFAASHKALLLYLTLTKYHTKSMFCAGITWYGGMQDI